MISYSLKPSNMILKTPDAGWRHSSEVAHLPSMCAAVGWIPSNPPPSEDNLEPAPKKKKRNLLLF
jgi:hypothetical protein